MSTKPSRSKIVLFGGERVFERALLREFTTLTAGVFFVLLAIVLVTRGVKFLGLAASGAVASDAVAAMLGFTALAYVPMILALTVFITVLMAVTRAYRDHEMAIWFSSGQPLTAWIKPVLVFAVPMAVLAGILSLGLTPWASQKGREYRDKMASREDLAAVAPGIFKESSRNDRVTFVENFSGEGGAARNVFVQQLKDGVQTVIAANQGSLITKPDGEREIALRNGRIYEGAPGSASYRVAEFDTMQQRIDIGPRRPTSQAVEASGSLALSRSDDPEHQAEFASRLAAPISTVLLALIALPLAFFNPRVGRAFNLILGVLIYTNYLYLLKIMTSWLASGRVPAWIGLWPVHALLLLLTVILFWWRLRPHR